MGFLLQYNPKRRNGKAELKPRHAPEISTLTLSGKALRAETTSRHCRRSPPPSVYRFALRVYQRYQGRISSASARCLTPSPLQPLLCLTLQPPSHTSNVSLALFAVLCY